METKKSLTGLDKEVAGSLSYILGPISGAIFLIVEKDPFVRFHAVQSIVLFISWYVLVTLLGLTIILVPIISLVSLLTFISWLVALFKAWKGEKWQIPVIGVYAQRWVMKIK